MKAPSRFERFALGFALASLLYAVCSKAKETDCRVASDEQIVCDEARPPLVSAGPFNHERFQLWGECPDGDGLCPMDGDGNPVPGTGRR